MALRIIDLDIDESLSADTRVSEVGWVFQPAIETELLYFSNDNIDPELLKKVKDYVQKLLRTKEEEMDYETGGLPGYVNYATGDTSNDMLIKPILFVERQAGESTSDYISRCVEYHIKNEGMESDQAYAICKSKSENFYKGEKVSFDYDDTLSTARGYGLALHEKFMGAELYIISARNDKAGMLPIADKLGIPHDRVFATGSNRLKIQKIKELNIRRHFDNNKEVIKELGNTGIQFSCPCLDEMVSMGEELNKMVEDFNLVGFMNGEPVFSTPEEAEVYGENEHGCSGHHTHTDDGGNVVYMGCETHPETMSFESITDYPQYITDTAIRAKNWVDENGYGSCMTPVGKSRLNQLANGEPLSLETLKRMKAFGSRHKTDWESSKSFEDGCGYLALASWGFEPSTYDEVMNYLDRVITREEMATVGPRGGINPSKKAPKSGTPNKDPKGEGTAKGDASSTRGAEVSKAVEEILQNKSDDFNEKYKDKLGYGVNLGMLKSVYQRGVGAYNTSHSPAVKSSQQWALGRVNAFLYLVKNGRPENPKYDGDYDLLPTKHPKKQDNMSSQFSLDDYSEEELETVKMLKFLMETDYEKFEAVIGSMRGATEQDVYRRNHKNPTIYFQYERVLSGSPDRDFCTSIEGRYFRRLEIDLLQGTNTEFGHERQPYSKWLYKGGPNCVHAWHKYLFQGKDKADQGMADGKAGTPPKSMTNNGYYSPETKRKSEVAYIVSQQNMSKQVFKVDKEQRMLYTPLMLPNILIPRNDGDGEIYFVRFRPEVIEKIRNKFMIEGRLRDTNYEHSDHKFSDIVMVESWIVDGPMDKAYQLGFTQKQVPFGSWMGGYKVLETEEGDIIWNDYIKSGKVRGASVEGEFLLKFKKEDFSTEDILLDKIIDILNQVGI